MSDIFEQIDQAFVSVVHPSVRHDSIVLGDREWKRGEIEDGWRHTSALRAMIWLLGLVDGSVVVLRVSSEVTVEFVNKYGIDDDLIDGINIVRSFLDCGRISEDRVLAVARPIGLRAHDLARDTWSEQRELIARMNRTCAVSWVLNSLSAQRDEFVVADVACAMMAFAAAINTDNRVPMDTLVTSRNEPLRAPPAASSLRQIANMIRRVVPEISWRT